MSKPYEKPVILKVQTGMMNKYGASPFYTRRVMEEIDGVKVSDLTDQFGSPLFVFSETHLREKFRSLNNAFSTRYPNIKFGWSYKTNYLPAICSIMHAEGACAEVVSEMEYDKARALGVPGDQIIYNGPSKTYESLKRAVRENAKIHIDHLDELVLLEKLADELKQIITVAMRLNMDTGIYPQWSRFGFNLETGAAMSAVKRMMNQGKLKLNGLHCHIGTYILEPNAYAVEIEKMIKFAREIHNTTDFKIEYFDIGGGFPSINKLKGTYQSPDTLIPSEEEYAEKITSALYQHLEPGQFPTIYLETGRALVDEAGYLITTITASKRLPDGRKAYIVDGGINLLYTAFWYKYNLALDRPVDGRVEPTIVYGPLCMNIDVVNEGTLLPQLDPGTRMIVYPVGAYNVTQWKQFIEYRPAVVLIDPNRKPHLIREKEDITDITRREKLPDYLSLNN